MHRRVIDDMKKESKALKRWMIVLYIAGISFIVSMWLPFDKELLYAYIIISVAVIIVEAVDDCVVHSRHIIYCFNVAPV